MHAYDDEELPAEATQQELRARAKSERQRVRRELHRLRGANASSAEDTDEPGPEYKAPRHRELANTRLQRPKRESRHWKLPFWKRRNLLRRERAEIERHPDE